MRDFPWQLPCQPCRQVTFLSCWDDNNKGYPPVKKKFNPSSFGGRLVETTQTWLVSTVHLPESPEGNVWGVVTNNYTNKKEFQPAISVFFAFG